MSNAVEVQLKALDDAGLLNASHAIIVQSIRELATAVALSAARGRATGTAAAARELRESLDMLPKTGDQTSVMAKLTKQLEELANAG
ncbi:hypothetical protein [Canibacter zhoujuaniae]|uniref:hypothetical protein n=1 Tax=Canibacter zhoujuaniae TaxID=2708343 RepID=UPI00141DB5E0|nr:hypothetical protein [Canibacter zhoujuaniae]